MTSRFDPGRLAASLGIAFLAILGLGLPFAPREMHLWIWYGAWISVSFMLLLNCAHCSPVRPRPHDQGRRFDARVAVYGSGVDRPPRRTTT